MITIVIIDDHPIARRGLEAMAAAHAQLRVLASAGSVAQLSHAAVTGAAAPDVAVVDLYLDHGQDQPAVNAIIAMSARSGVLVMSAFAGRDQVMTALRAGARGYITKHASESSFIAAIECVASGGFYLSAALAYMLQDDLAQPSHQPAPPLSPREAETLDYIARGLTHAQTAARMGISETTVNTHIERIRRKLGLGNKAELTRMAIQLDQHRLRNGTDKTSRDLLFQDRG
jgi:two-component system nitrate/nitrite response regulator NarL